LRYPGYYGPEYKENGILCIAWVHNARQLFQGSFLGVEQATFKSKISKRENSDAYIAAIQNGYINAITEWGPWAQFGPPIKHILGLIDDLQAAHSIAYVDFVKCWPLARAVNSKGRVVAPIVMNVCQDREPIENLVGYIDCSDMGTVRSEIRSGYAARRNRRSRIPHFCSWRVNWLAQDKF